MKQSTSTSSSKESAMFDSATEDEIMVAQILLELNVLISLSESLKSFNWGCTRRRSALDAPPSSSPAPPSPLPTVQRNDDEKGAAAEDRITGSPETPLAFPSSETEQYYKHSPKTSSKKRSKEEYMELIEELSQNREVLKREVEKVMKHYNNLKAYNSQLKAMKLEVLNTSQNEDLNLGTELAHHPPITIAPHHPPSIADPTSQDLQNSFGPITAHVQPSNNGPGPVNHVGPSGIDLNISAEESLEVDQRARFAEARRRRIVKIKSMRSASGIKLPRTKE